MRKINNFWMGIGYKQNRKKTEGKDKGKKEGYNVNFKNVTC